jgi:hypothetical protein
MATLRPDGSACECGRPIGKCVKGDLVRCPTEDDDYDCCPACGGSGVIDDECTCMDDTCCCLVPTPPICSECNGRG